MTAETMHEPGSRGIYLGVEFTWPSPLEPEVAQKAAHLHRVVQDKIREEVIFYNRKRGVCRT